jgi:hypothetical protein
MGKSAERTEVTPGKLRALREKLDAEGHVTFANGNTAKLLPGGSVKVTIRFGKFGVERTYGMRKLEAAYDWAVNWRIRSRERERPPRKPCWFDPDKPRPARPEWDDPPF